MKDHLAVFDWNATLFDDMAATHIATNECLAFFDIAPISLEQEQELFSFPLIHFYEKMGVSADEYLKHAAEVGDIFHLHYNKHKQDCTLKVGALDVLKWFKNEGVTLKILSNHVHETLEGDIARFGIEGYFDAVSGNKNPATIIEGMNKFERLEAFLTQNGFSADKTFIIGDSHEEPELARKMDILGISITGGLLSPARIAKCKKDYVVDELTELPAILAREWGLDAGNFKQA